MATPWKPNSFQLAGAQKVSFLEPVTLHRVINVAVMVTVELVTDKTAALSDTDVNVLDRNILART